jgi:hypothetical protein
MSGDHNMYQKPEREIYAEIYKEKNVYADQKQDPPIVVEMNILDKNLAVLQDLIIVLESRIAPVLQEVPPAPQEAEKLVKSALGSSSLYSGLRSLNDHVLRLHSRIIEIKERVEV